MGAAHVQTVSKSQAANTTISQAITLTAGNAVLVVGMFDTSHAGAGTITQSAGDTLTLVASWDNSAHYTEIYINHNVAGGATTFTLNWTNSQSANVFVTEVSGLASASAFDKTASTAAVTLTTVSSGTTAALAQADEFALAAFHADGSGSASVSSMSNGFTVPTNGSLLGAVAGCKGAIAYAVTTTTAAKETTLTASDALAVTGLIATFKAAASTPDLSVLLVEPTMTLSIIL